MRSLSKYNYLERYLVKESRSQALGGVVAGQGPVQMNNALNMLEQARALVRPDDAELGKRDIKRSEFADIVEELSQRPGQFYDTREIKADPKKRALYAGLAGALGGGMIGSQIPTDPTNNFMENLYGPLAGMALGGGAGALGGYLHGKSRNRKLRGTLNVLKDSGLLKPEYLRRAKPLLIQT